MTEADRGSSGEASVGCEPSDAPAELAASAAPRVSTQEVPECPVCAGTDWVEWSVGFDYELRTCSNRWRLVQCTDCSHVWLNPRPSVVELGIIYPASYYAYNYERIRPLARRAKEMLDRRKMSSILRHLGRAPISFLDIGCGDGRYLRMLEGRGVTRDRLYGLELDATVVQSLADDGYQVFRERVEDSRSVPDHSIDLATMFHVLEHVDDPAAVARRVRDWLTPGGLWALETPNLSSLDANLFRDRYWGGYHFPRHWNIFSLETLSRLLEDAGFDVQGVSYQTGHSFWMYSLHHVLRYHPRRQWPRLARWFDPLTNIPFLAFFTTFDKMRASLGARTSAMLVLARKPT